ncbi:hypothetical protein RUM44_009690 [Polyplax serrata]|uniref:Uncharacterized protein n=1 Tax=Polyplax serrata TaxID=468196 RepID=A0ABR1ATN8_POLSC
MKVATSQNATERTTTTTTRSKYSNEKTMDWRRVAFKVEGVKENEFSRVDTSIAKSSLKSENKRFVLLLYFSTNLKLRLRPVKKVRKELSRRQRERGRWVRGENQGGFALMPKRVVGGGQVMKTKNNAMD